MSFSLGHLSESTSVMKDPDISQLVSQNQTLSAELAQCQADKDFVWSLWKKLQVSNPDVTEAISLVIQREKEKSENKDRKVLEIIQVKDDRIEELQNIAAKQAEEFSDVLSKKVELAEKSCKLQVDNDKLQEKVSSLQNQIRSDQNRERSLEETFRKAVESAETERYVLTRKVAELTTDLEVVKSEKAHAVSRQKILEERIRTLEKEVSDKMVKFEALVREVEDSSSRLSLYESQTLQQRRELEFKNQELDNVRRELRELWSSHNQLIEHSGQQADLIKQLQSLQQDTQKMMKNQEDAFCMESSSLQQMFSDVSTRYESAKRIEADLRQQVLELKKTLMDKDDVISSLQSQQETLYHHSSHLTDNHQPGLGVRADYSNSFLDILQEVDSIGNHRAENTRSRGRSLNRLHDLESRSNYDLDIIRSRSLSPPTKDTESVQGPFDFCKLSKLQKELALKTRQLEQMRKAHDKRLQRFQNLQASYRLAREEIKSLEFSRGKTPRKPKRADARSLQKENSDQVWNELTFFKSENRTLQVDKMSLQEEVDLLRVQASQDVASIHELKMAVQSQKEEYEFHLRSLRRESRDVKETNKQLSLLKVQVQNKTAHIGKLERDIVSAISQRDDLMQEKSKLISQLTSTQQEASKHRMELADMKHQLQSLRHKLEDLQQMPHMGVNDDSNRIASSDDSLNLVHAVASNLMTKKTKRTTRNIPNRYQKHVNHMPGETSGVDNCIDEEWEEVSDAEGHSDSDFEPPRLGRTITRRAHVKGWQVDSNGKKMKPRRVPTHRPPHAKSNSQSSERASSSSKSPQWIRGSVDHVSRREFATSPIMFLNPTSAPSFPLSSLPALSAPASGRCSSSTAATSVRPSRKVIESRQMATLRQRIFRLQTHVSLLKKARMCAVQSEEALAENVAKLKAELSLALGRLKSAKQSIQKLQTDLEKLQKEKQEMDGGSATKVDQRSELTGDGQELKILEAKLKAATSEVSKQSASLRSVKTENESLQEQVRSLQDRINHLERDVNQKRNLLENQKFKLKHAQDISKADADNVEELQTRNKLLIENNNKMKVQLDSLKKRLIVVMKEKKEYEQKSLKVSLELDHKNKLLQEASSHRINLELALADLETSAHQQLHGLATQSEAAIDVAKEKLTTAQTRLTQFCSLVKILTSELVNRTEQTRSKLREAKMAQQHSQDNDLSLQRAQDKARDILNLSYSDIEDIMSADGDRDTKDSGTAEEKKLDRRWLRKCEKLINSKEDFVQPLVSLLLQKVDERANLLLQLSC